MDAIRLLQDMAMQCDVGHLLWLPEHGVGHHTDDPISYDGPYFENYKTLDNTPMGEALTAARWALVLKHAPADAEIVDFGIGGGGFMLMDAACRGYDVNPEAVEFLSDCGRLHNPEESCQVATFWDSLEHMPDPGAVIDMVDEWAFISIPVFESAEACVKSKHYKPGEHLWYFTATGLARWMRDKGFECVEINHAETELGREGIASFAFKRVS